MPVIAATEGRAYPYEPQRTALMIIDMQRDFIESGGACDVLGADVRPLQAIVPQVAALLAFARKAGLRVVHTRYGFKPDLSDLSQAVRLQSCAAGGEYGTPGPLGRMFVAGEAGFGIIAALTPLPDETVVDKPTFGAFAGSDLHRRLSRDGIDHLIVCGVTTQCCVESSVREAVDLGYFVLTVQDACAAFEPALHEATFRAIASETHLFGWIASTADVVASRPRPSAHGPDTHGSLMEQQPHPPSDRFFGGCQCGRTRYRLASKPVNPVLCQCRMCQKATGAALLTYAAVPTADFAWTRGAPKTFRSSSIAFRDFCPECGTQLTFRFVGVDDVIDIMLMTLDRWNEIAPLKQVGLESRPSWLPQLDRIPALTTVESHGAELMAKIRSFQHPDRESPEREEP